MSKPRGRIRWSWLPVTAQVRAHEYTLICTEEEREATEAVEADPGHTHGEDCYEDHASLICGLEEGQIVPPYAGQTETEGPGDAEPGETEDQTGDKTEETASV